MKDMLGTYLLKWRIKTVLPYIHGKLLDVGCGTNELVRNYKGFGIGVDVYQWGDVDLVLTDTSKLPFKSKEFDTITIVASLNHIPNRKEVLKEVHRILKNNGKLIITMIPPFLSRIWHFLRKPWDVDQKERGMKENEVYGLTDREVELLLKNAGFKICYKNRFMFFINRLTVAQKV